MTLNINSLSTENVLFSQKLLQELSDNKTLNLSEDQKTAFKNVLSETLLKSSNEKNISNLQIQTLLQDSKTSNIMDLYSDSSFQSLLTSNLDKSSDLSAVQKQLFKKIGLPSDDTVSPSSNILIEALAKSTSNENKVSGKSQVDYNNVVKAKKSYQQQLPINLSTNIGEMSSRIEHIRSNFFA